MPQLNAFDQAIEDLDRPKKTRKKSHTEELAKWFWVEVLHHANGMYKDPKWWRYMAEASRLLDPQGRHYAVEIIQAAIKLVLADRGEVETMTCVEWIKNGVTYYELASDPLLTAPPIYTIDFQWWSKEHEQSIAGR